MPYTGIRRINSKRDYTREILSPRRVTICSTGRGRDTRPCLAIGRKKVCKGRGCISTKRTVKQSRGRGAFFDKRHYFQEESLSTIRGTIYRIRNNPKEQGLCARRVYCL